MLQTALEILKEDERQIVLLHASAGLKAQGNFGKPWDSAVYGAVKV